MAENNELPLRYVIIDDNSISHEVLRDYLGKRKDIQYAGKACDAFDGLRLLHDKKPDIVILNVTMPVMSGLQMLDYFDTQSYYVVFSSVLPQTHVQDPRVRDYLSVPHQQGALNQIINKAVSYLRQSKR